MACGTGKTLVANWVREGLSAVRTIVFVPSIALIAQTIREWTAACSDNFEALAVCCDATVADSGTSTVDGDEDESTANVEAAVTTDYRSISAFLQKPGHRVVFSTYQSSETVAEALSLAGTPQCDLVIADEAHRTAGALGGLFTTVLDDNRVPSVHKLFMTATPRLYHENSDTPIASMDDEKLYGPEFHRLDLADAVARGLLSDYEILIVFATTKEARDLLKKNPRLRVRDRALQARELAVRIALLRAMAERKLRRMITFHSSTARAASHADFVPHLHAWLPDKHKNSIVLWAKTVNYRMSMDERRLTLKEFVESSSPGILTNAKCLGEGVDVPTVDGIAFMDAKSSKIEIVQAVGRAIRKADGKSKATIVIPVIYSETAGSQQFNDRKFRPILDILSAIRAHDSTVLDRLERWHPTATTERLHTSSVSAGQSGRSSMFSVSSSCDKKIADWFVARVIQHAGDCVRDKWQKSYEDVRKTLAAGLPLSRTQKLWIARQRYAFDSRTNRRKELIAPLLVHVPEHQPMLKRQLEEILAVTTKNGYVSSVKWTKNMYGILDDAKNCRAGGAAHIAAVKALNSAIRAFPTKSRYDSVRIASRYADEIDAVIERTGQRPKWKQGSDKYAAIQWVYRCSKNSKLLYGVRPTSWVTAYFKLPKSTNTGFNRQSALTGFNSCLAGVKAFYAKHGVLPRTIHKRSPEARLADRMNHYTKSSQADVKKAMCDFIAALPVEARNHSFFSWMQKVVAYVKRTKKYITDCSICSATRTSLIAERRHWLRHKDKDVRDRTVSFETNMLRKTKK